MSKMLRIFSLVLGAGVLIGGMGSPVWAQETPIQAQTVQGVVPPELPAAQPEPAAVVPQQAAVVPTAPPTSPETAAAIPAPAPVAAPAEPPPPPAALPSLGEALDQALGEGASQPGMNLPIDETMVSEPQKTPEDLQMELREEAFDAAMTGLLPLQPPQIRKAIELFDINQKAIEEPLAYPKPELGFTTISLDPGQPPLTFKLATGHVTSISIVDVTGQPWPIRDISWAGNFEVDDGAVGGDPAFANLIRIIPMSEYAYGNMSMRLVGLPTPITFTLRTGREEVQYRLDIRVPQYGPLALPPLIDPGVSGLSAGDTTLTAVMEGVPPASAEKLKVTGADGRTAAWKIGDVTYVRTPLTLLSPGWKGSVRSTDGTNVYAITDSPVLVLSDQGKMVRAHVQAQNNAGEN